MLRKLFRIISGFLVIIICVSSVSCDLPSKTPIERGDDVVLMINEKMNNDKYLPLTGVRGEQIDFIHSLRTEEYLQKAAVYQIHLSEADYYANIYGSDLSEEDLPKTLYDSLRHISATIIAQRICMPSDLFKRSAIGVLSTSFSFHDSSVEEDALYLYVFQSAAPILISITKSTVEEGIVTIAGGLIVNDQFYTDDEENIARSFEYFGYVCLSVKKIR